MQESNILTRSTFADVWNKTMQGPSTLFFVEFLCRVEAGPDRLAHEWSSKVLHDGVGGQDNAEAEEPGSASSLMNSDQQKCAAEKWLRREIKILTAAVPTEEEENDEEDETETREEHEIETETQEKEEKNR